ncbi:hypothetical protein F0562_014638 [Nyssa sinensis]|uniref:Uncharacterized protein n=1 Tax=Nyssa sinensis TaxID=561372 RepID=A0A5J4ZSL5_9ASTE|nr:hypothetical protein F0562_014638 [Nyssa sinensis]
MAVVRAPGSLLTALRFETSNSSNGVPAPRNPDQPLPRLSVSKPSWVIRTESNVQKEQRKEARSTLCGRTNCVNLAMLPKRGMAKMVRCRTCGRSGLGYCSRCLGTGEYRYIMGFHFMKKDTDHVQDGKKYQVRDNPGFQSAADLLLNDEKSNSHYER